MEIKKSALCDDVADEGGCSEKQRFLHLSIFLLLYLIQHFLNQLVTREIKKNPWKLILTGLWLSGND